ncbi:cytosine(34)-C(5)-methyltransferase-like protein [Zopfochytrium polystomum]|nr:cytosine(34)-C(5)-methyltransferase-like protein [Zopfochytrium polystomum]
MGRGGGRGGRGRGRGRGWGRRGGGRGRGDPDVFHADPPKNGDPERVNYTDVPLENAAFERYYKAQGIVPESDWRAFMDILKTGLPSSFRFTGSKSHASDLRDIMVTNYFPALQNVEVDGEPVPPPRCLEWYPNQLGWQYDASRSAIRRDPAIARFHNFLIGETEVGNISRQETVSMIPPLLLQVEPHHYVLDMCAAPGSKTAQLIEALHASDETLPSGIVIANDADSKRSHLLVHQAKRLQSPCLMVTNHEGQIFPYIYFVPKKEMLQPGEEKAMLFDRVLCDVPCSGDGTMRKNKLIWTKWTNNDGNALHRLQLPILLRACELTRVGGRIVYSTCTFNPVENEAVVAAALNATGGALELLDVSSELPGLKRNPGMTSWKVMDSRGEFHDSYDTVDEALKQKKIPATLFPPKNAKELGLEKCMRLLPHHQNSGGFFICAFKKVAPYGHLDKHDAQNADDPADEMEESESGKRKSPDDDDDTANDENGKEGVDSKRPRVDDATEGDVAAEANSDNVDEVQDLSEGKVARSSKLLAAWEGKEEPFLFLPDDDATVNSIIDFYKILPSFPKDQYVVRSEKEDYRAIYFVSSSVKKVLTAHNSNKLKIINTGIKLFIRTPANESRTTVPYRFSSEGIQVLTTNVLSTSSDNPQSGSRVIEGTADDVKVLLEKNYPHFTELSEVARDGLAKIEEGSALMRVVPFSIRKEGLQTPLLVPLWRAQVSVSLLVPKQERDALLARVTGVYPDRNNRTAGVSKRNRGQAAAAEEAAAVANSVGGAGGRGSGGGGAVEHGNGDDEANSDEENEAKDQD